MINREGARRGQARGGAKKFIVDLEKAPRNKAGVSFDSLLPSSSPFGVPVHVASLDSPSAHKAHPRGFTYLCRSLPSGSIPAGLIATEFARRSPSGRAALVVAGVLLAVLDCKPKPPEVIEETETALV